MVNAWKIIAATLVIYTAGLVTGTFLKDIQVPSHRIGGRPDPMPRGPRMHDFIQRFGKQLELTDTQRTNITEILKASQVRMDTLMKEMRPRIAEEFTSVNAEIKALLNEKQAKVFERVMKSRRNMGRGFGNGPGRGGRGMEPGHGPPPHGEGFRGRKGKGPGRHPDELPMDDEPPARPPIVPPSATQEEAAEVEAAPSEQP